jgi:hypothetical protein
MSIGYFATLAGENADAARSWKGATRSWQQHSANLENALLDERDKNWRLKYQLKEAHQNNASWQAHAKQLEDKVRNWQQSAIESEAISRAKTQYVKDKFGEPTSEYLITNEGQQLIQSKQAEVVQEWGIDPWAENKG